MGGSETAINLAIPDISLMRAIGNYMIHSIESFKSMAAAEAEFLLRARKGLTIYDPELISEGEGGAYLLKDEEGESLAVFKPMFEEPFSSSNPKRSSSDTDCNDAELKRGIRSGEPAIREVAAYILDHLEFAGVPMTLLVSINEKTGSLQEYKQHDFESWDLGPSKYDTDQVHKIGLLDLRLFNIDRHGGNILVRSMPNGKNLLIPIDHGFSLPDDMDATDVWFEWYNWPQAQLPFDRAAINYVSKIQVVKDAETLIRLGIRKECVRTMVISSLVLKKGVSNGLNLHQIASLFMKTVIGRRRQQLLPSIVEQLSEKIPSFEDEHFWDSLNLIIDAEIGRKIQQAKKFLRGLSFIVETVILPPREDQIWRRNQLRASA